MHRDGGGERRLPLAAGLRATRSFHRLRRGGGVLELPQRDGAAALDQRLVARRANATRSLQPLHEEAVRLRGVAALQVRGGEVVERARLAVAAAELAEDACRLGVMKQRVVERALLLQQTPARRRERPDDRASVGAPGNGEALVEASHRHLGPRLEHRDDRGLVQGRAEPLVVTEPPVAVDGLGHRDLCAGEAALATMRVGAPQVGLGLPEIAASVLGGSP